jgi:hypothetical protein
VSDLIKDDSIMQTAYLPSTPFDAPHNRLVSVTRFRADFPAFKDEATYPDHSVQFWLDVAGIMAIPRYWCQFTVLGQELLTAHFLALQQYYAIRSASGGGGSTTVVPGLPVGLMSSKSVSKVSVSYDYSSSTMEGWGPYNLTTFGQQYAMIAQMVGTGGVEMLAMSSYAQAGLVNSWAHGVMMGYYGSVG